MLLSDIWLYSRVFVFWLLVFEEGSHSLWHLLPVVKPSYPLSCVKLIPPVVSSIGLNYFLFLSESRLWGAVLWHRGALSWLEETSSLYRDLHGWRLIHWFRCRSQAQHHTATMLCEVKKKLDAACVLDCALLYDIMMLWNSAKLREGALFSGVWRCIFQYCIF